MVRILVTLVFFERSCTHECGFWCAFVCVCVCLCVCVCVCLYVISLCFSTPRYRVNSKPVRTFCTLPGYHPLMFTTEDLTPLAGTLTIKKLTQYKQDVRADFDAVNQVTAVLYE